MIGIGFRFGFGAGGGGAAPWTPADLTNLAFWYDSADMGTLWQGQGRTGPATTAGDAIANLSNKQGLSTRDAVQATATARPALQFGGGYGSGSLNPDPDLAQGATLYSTIGSSVSFQTVAGGKTGTEVMRGGISSTLAGSQIRSDGITAQRVAYDPAKTYRFVVWARASSTADGAFFALLNPLDSSGNVITSSTGVSGFAQSGPSLYSPSNEILSTGWVRYETVFGAGTSYTPPTGTAFLTVGAVLNNTSTAGYHEAQGISIEEGPLVSTVEFDGVDDWLSSGAATLGQTVTRISCFRILNWANNVRIFSSPTNRMILTMSGTADAPRIGLWNGSAFIYSPPGAVSVGQDLIVYEQVSSGGFGSLLVGVNPANAISGTVGANDPGGLVLGANNGGSVPSNVRIHGVIEKTSGITQDEFSPTIAWMAERYGVDPTV